MRKIAVFHEWLASYAGSERVVEQILLQYPEADLFAVADILPPEDRAFLRGKVPRPVSSKSCHAEEAGAQLSAADADGCRAMGSIGLRLDHLVESRGGQSIITGPYQLHISYVHTPFRYAWEFQYQYLRESNLDRGLRSSMFIRAMLHYMRFWDYAAASRVDVFVANSEFIANRIRKCYGRDAEVIYPPVDVYATAPITNKDDYYLAASRLVPYKRVDLIIEAFRQMPDRKLLVAGDGPMYKKLKAIAPANVELLGFLPHDRLKN